MKINILYRTVRTGSGCAFRKETAMPADAIPFCSYRSNCGMILEPGTKEWPVCGSCGNVICPPFQYSKKI